MDEKRGGTEARVGVAVTEGGREWITESEKRKNKEWERGREWKNKKKRKRRKIGEDR